MKTTSSLPLAFVGLSLALTSLPACSQGPSGPPTGSAEERTETVREALDSPSGVVDKVSAKAVLSRSGAHLSLGSLLGFMLPIPGMDKYPAPLAGDKDLIASCTDLGILGGTIDVGCATSDFATGMVIYNILPIGPKQYVDVRVEEACIEGKCVDGMLYIEVALDADAGEALLTGQASLDLSDQGETAYHTETGYVVSVGDAGLEVHWVFWDDQGASYGLDASTSPDFMSGDATLTGDNGAYTCSYEAAGVVGSCNGPDGSFSW